MGAAALAALLVAGCGGQRQDASEPSGSFPMRVVNASFPTSQRLSREATMRITVENTGNKAVPEVAVTVFKTGNGTHARAFSDNSKQPDLADSSRPIWIVDRAPYGGDTAYSNTWALGRLGPNRSRTFTWKVSPVRAGSYSISYEVAAGLNGQAKAKAPGGGIPRGVFKVAVSGAPAQSTVNDNGNVVGG